MWLYLSRNLGIIITLCKYIIYEKSSLIISIPTYVTSTL